MSGAILAVGGAIGSSFVSLFTVETLKFLAYRALCIVLVWTIVPFALFKAFGIMVKYFVPWMIAQFSTMASSVLGQNMGPQVVSLVGVGAYLGDLLKVPQAMAVFMSWLIFKFVWGFIPKPLSIGHIGG